MSVHIPPPTISSPPPPPEPIWRLTVAQYHQMIDAGILTEDDPVELLEGVLVAKMPKNPSHRAVTRRIKKALEAMVPSDWSVDSQDPITLSDSEPEPDIVVSRGDTSEITDRHPGPGDIGLVVEVADTTLSRDRTSKKRVYARAGLLVYWIVNIADRQIEVYTDPSGPADTPEYRHRQDFHLADEIPVIIGGQDLGHIRVQTLFPSGN
jgi:Uma2 family endonuclease